MNIFKKMKKKDIIVSGFSNPIHKGHIEYLNNAKTFTNNLFVIIKNDIQRAIKGFEKLQEENVRLFIVQNSRSVDKAII